MSISISYIKDHSISVDQARYAASIVAKYIYNSTAKKSTKFIRPIFYHIILTKDDVSTSDEQVDNLTRVSIFTTDIVLDNLFICYLQDYI